MSDSKNLQLYEADDRAKLSKTALETKSALDKIVSKKLHNGKVTTLSSQATNSDTSYVRYTSSQIADLNTGTRTEKPKQRIIKITDDKVDPMLPQSFRIRKVPDGPQSDSFTTIMHDESNVAKLTKNDQKKWEIAPSVSNWKNTKGFIIGIENRLQNSNAPNTLTDEEIERSTKRFTDLSDALKNAENKAKQDLKARANWRKRAETEEFNKTQEKLGKLAEEARNQRRSDQLTLGDVNDSAQSTMQEDTEDSKLSDKLKRRAERRKRAEAELNSERVSTKQKVRKLAKEQGREVSERIVLGVSEALKKKQKETVYDSDLYLRTAGGSNKSIFDEPYDKPLFTQEAALSDVYRARNMSGHAGLGSKNGEESTSTSVAFVRDGKTKEEGETGE